MDRLERGQYPREVLALCRHPEVEWLRPDTASSEDVWVPTVEQLRQLLVRFLPYPGRSVLRHTGAGWEYQVDFREWAGDYGTEIETRRRFIGDSVEDVLLQALIAVLGIGDRWMV